MFNKNTWYSMLHGLSFIHVCTNEGVSFEIRMFNVMALMRCDLGI